MGDWEMGKTMIEGLKRHVRGVNCVRPKKDRRAVDRPTAGSFLAPLSEETRYCRTRANEFPPRFASRSEPMAVAGSSHHRNHRASSKLFTPENSPAAGASLL
jgi:hypothetical protein